MKWQYDGSFSGFLTTVFQIYLAKDKDADINPPELLSELDLWLPENRRIVSTDNALALRVYRGVANQGGPTAAIWLRDAFLHRDPSPEPTLLGFVRCVMNRGTAALEQLATPSVQETVRRSRAVQREVQRYQGLLRFSSIDHDDIGLYAAFKPDHQILSLLIPHFRDRLGECNWMIHDVGRSQAALYSKGKLQMLENIVIENRPPESDTETEFHQLWQSFFTNIAIPDRGNPELQRSRLPKKCWAWLTEQPGSSSCTGSSGSDYNSNHAQIFTG